MIIELEIPDTVYKRYQKHDPKNPEKALVANLKQFAEVGPNDRVVLLGGKDREALEILLERHLGNGSELVTFVREALKLKLDGVELVPNPDILNLIKQQSDFDGREYKDFLTDKLTQALGIAAQGF